MSVEQIEAARNSALNFIRVHAGPTERTDLAAAFWADLPMRPQVPWCASAWDEELIAEGLLTVADAALSRRTENDGEFRELNEYEIAERLAYFLNQVVPRCPREGSVQQLVQRIAEILESDGRRSRAAGGIARAASEVAGLDQKEAYDLFERVRKQIERRTAARNEQDADDARIAARMRNVERGFRIYPAGLENLVESARRMPHDPTDPLETGRVAAFFARYLCSGLLPADLQRVKSKIARALRPRPSTAEQLVRVALTAAGVATEFFEQVRLRADGTPAFPAAASQQPTDR